MKRTIAIIGSRTYPQTSDEWTLLDDASKEKWRYRGQLYVSNFMQSLTGGKDLTIVSGGAAGPDTWALEIAYDLGFTTVEIKPDWKKYGKGAGLKRNSLLVELADDVVAFWDIASNGTFDTLKKAANARKPLMIFGPDGELFFYATEEDYDKDKVKVPAMWVPRSAK